MSNSPIVLDQIKVASPCHASWDDMSGDERSRFCGQCGKHVYNLSEMTREQATALVSETEGRMCVRFYRRSDGTMLTQDCPVGWRAVRRRALLLTGAAAAILFAFLGVVTSIIAGAVGWHHGWRPRPVVWVVDLLDPPPMRHPAIAFPPGAIDRPHAVVMGEMCVPDPVQHVPEPAGPPKQAVEARP